MIYNVQSVDIRYGDRWQTSSDDKLNYFFVLLGHFLHETNRFYYMSSSKKHFST